MGKWEQENEPLSVSNITEQPLEEYLQIGFQTQWYSRYNGGTQNTSSIYNEGYPIAQSTHMFSQFKLCH